MSFKIIIESSLKIIFRRRQKMQIIVSPQTFQVSIIHTYIADGYQGYGDFTIMPYAYNNSGGPANAVAIHLVGHTDKKNIMNHFISDDNKDASNPAEKYDQARRKLIHFLGRNPHIDITTGATLFRDEHFPELGVLKRMSMIHHIEYMASL